MAVLAVQGGGNYPQCWDTNCDAEVVTLFIGDVLLAYLTVTS